MFAISVSETLQYSVVTLSSKYCLRFVAIIFVFHH